MRNQSCGLAGGICRRIIQECLKLPLDAKSAEKVQSKISILGSLTCPVISSDYTRKNHTCDRGGLVHPKFDRGMLNWFQSPCVLEG